MPALPELHPFVHLVFLGIIALFPVVNPVGSAFIVMPYFAHLSDGEKKSAVRKITLYAFGVCTIALFAGQYIMELFGISIPVVQLAGGIMICKFGWEFLSADKEKTSKDEPETHEAAYESLKDKLFYPITFPITTGAGTISVLFTLSAHSSNARFRTYLLNEAALVVAIVITCFMIYFFFLNTRKLVAYLGESGEKIFNRLLSFLIFCVGIQIASTGAKALFLETSGPETTRATR